MDPMMLSKIFLLLFITWMTIIRVAHFKFYAATEQKYFFMCLKKNFKNFKNFQETAIKKANS